MRKHLIICLDGTWCDGDSPEPQTNVRILSDIFDPKPEDGPDQKIYYDAGVGTRRGFVGRIAGGLFGKGVSANVLAAYRFLSQFYVPGDNIYIFGFSRGAFTARSLCGFISASGLLTQDMCNQANQDFAWNYYRTPPKARYPADRARLGRITHPDVRVRFLGVFDTVGALGVPKGFMNGLGRRAIEFHDTEVSSVVDHSCQALAIDEHRVEFQPAVWTEPRHRKYKTVEQVWFPGTHANVGGGCADTDLSDLPLMWMLQRLQCHCKELRFSPNVRTPLLERLRRYPNSTGKIIDPRGWIFWRSRVRPVIRLINGLEPPKRWPWRLLKLPPHAQPIGEMVHQSARDRFEKTKAERRRQRYQPLNLLAALEAETPVVGLDGEPIWPAPRGNGADADAAALVQDRSEGPVVEVGSERLLH